MSDLGKALSFMRVWISEDAHLGESEISYEFERAEGLRKLDAIEEAAKAAIERENEQLRMTNHLLSKSEKAKDEHIEKLEKLVCDIGKALIHDNCYRWCEAKESCNLISDGKCQFRERMAELGIEVGHE